MKISKMIEELGRIKAEHGDLEVTCTHSLLPEAEPGTPNADVFETTVENLSIEKPAGNFGKRVRVWL